MHLVLQRSRAPRFNLIDNAQHARKRKLLSNVFATKNLIIWIYKVADKGEHLLRQSDGADESAKESEKS
ncbi:unnamed protein product [Diplocarpon coronariae]